MLTMFSACLKNRLIIKEQCLTCVLVCRFWVALCRVLRSKHRLLPKSEVKDGKVIVNEHTEDI